MTSNKSIEIIAPTSATQYMQLKRINKNLQVGPIVSNQLSQAPLCKHLDPPHSLRCTMKILLFAVSLIFLTIVSQNNLSADEVIKPTQIFTGTQADTSARITLPRTRVITNQTTFDSAWRALGIVDAKPKIDWNTELVLADSVSGPNKMNALPLNVKNGQLKFVTMSTKMGGPGFGFLLMRIPRKGITHVNEVAVGLDKTIDPIATYRGASDDQVIMSAIAPSNIIKDQNSFGKAWKAIGQNGQAPTIDWDTELVLVAKAQGNTNKITLDKLILEAGGRLRFSSFATEMGSPGYCYLMVRVPKQGIEFVNRKQIPKHDVGDGLPVADGVTVNIVGKLKTGIIAIGGETTGTTITSDNITFEVDLTADRGLQAVAQKFKNQRVRVLGALSKQKGVEIRERWILKATSIEEVATGETSEKETALEKSFVEIKFSLSGGIAGLNEELTIDADGKVEKVNRSRRVTENWQADPKKLAKLHALVGKTEWSKIPKNGKRNRPIPDALAYKFTIDTGKRTFRFSRNDFSLLQSKELAELAKLLNK